MNNAVYIRGVTWTTLHAHGSGAVIFLLGSSPAFMCVEWLEPYLHVCEVSIRMYT